ncbi:MAG: hypothetical protein L6R39_007732 [Caloplaca ligustica]|nr:MAG: hypothetical protein L6R39_007732 [Caloplaca ligustica]
MAEENHYGYHIPDYSSTQSYYDTWESRIGYRVFLGGTRHFGYYEPDTLWPFPLSTGLRRMEDHLYESLGLPLGAEVLDAGCGAGHVALHLAHKGLRVQAIDITPNHARWAQQEVERQGMQDMVRAQWGDYHNLDFDDQSFDGVYTMETLVHSPDPAKAVSEIYRVLQPGGHVVFHEYDHPEVTKPPPDCPPALIRALIRVNFRSGMQGTQYFGRGALQQIMEDQGFVDITERDLTENIRPLMRLFYIIGFLPYLLICLLGLQKWFVNTEAAVQGYRAMARGYWRYIVLTARKPGTRRDDGEGAEGVKQRRRG